MKLVNNMYFPDYDRDCAAVTFSQSADARYAVQHCLKTDVVIQAGGNVGVWAKVLSNTFKKVYSFEPDADNYECLWENTIDDANIYIENLGLGDVNTRKSIKQIPYNCGANCVIDGDGCEIVTIDSLDLDPDLIILDIEGYEELAFKGALNTIKRCHPVLMYEDKDLSLPYTGHKRGYIEKWMEEFGYNVVKRIHRDVILAHNETYVS